MDDVDEGLPPVDSAGADGPISSVNINNSDDVDGGLPPVDSAGADVGFLLFWTWTNTLTSANPTLLWAKHMKITARYTSILIMKWEKGEGETVRSSCQRRKWLLNIEHILILRSGQGMAIF